MRLRSLFFLLIGAVIAPASGQDKPKGPFKQPLTWHQVRYEHGGNHFYPDPNSAEAGTEEYWKFTSSTETSINRWWVFTSAAGIQLSAKAEANAQKIGAALPLSQRFVVFEENDEWLRVGSDEKKGPEGWCHKRDLILWHEPLVEPNTRIELKAFLVNTSLSTTELRKTNDNEHYQIFSGPGSNASVVENRFLYDVLYVYKYAEESGTKGRYLVGVHSQLGPDKPLLGWVSRERVKVWTTRLCLEPNFDPKAIEERRSKDVPAKLFVHTDTRAIENYLLTGKGKGLVDGCGREPANCDAGDPHTRMAASLFRYPVFNARWNGLQPDNCMFTTGVSATTNIGSGNVLAGFNEDTYLKMQKTFEKSRQNTSLINVVFVVEGSGDSKDHFDLVRGCMNDLHAKYGASNTLRLGAVVYRNDYASQDATTNPEKDYLEVMPLTNNVGDAVAWINGRLPMDAGDVGEGRSVYFALKKGIGLLREHETNVLVHVGRRPDNTRDNGFYDGKTATAIEDLAAPLTVEKTLHYLGFVTMGPVEKVPAMSRQTAYVGMQGDVMENFAHTLNNRHKGVLEFAKETEGRAEAAVAEPGKETGMDIVRMTRTDFMLKSHMLTTPQAPSVLQLTVVREVTECVDLSMKRLDNLQKLLEGNSSIAQQAGDFTYDISGVMDQGGMDSEEFREFLASQRVHVFIDASTYYKTKASGLNEPLFRYVLFYSAKDLTTEIGLLDKLITLVNNEDPEEVRLGLEKYWKQRAKEVMGTEYDEKVSPVEVRSRLMGIHQMEMVKPFKDAHVLSGLSLDDLGNKSKFTLKAMASYLAEMEARLGLLKDLQTKGDCYHVPGDDSRKYYWVPIEYLFN